MFLKIDVLEILVFFNKVAGEAFQNTFFYRTLPVPAFVVFAAK